jgi:hypothetical protein
MLESVHSRLTAPQQRQPPASSQYRRVPGLQSPGAIIVGAMSAGRIWDLGISTAFAFSLRARQPSLAYHAYVCGIEIFQTKD